MSNKIRQLAAGLEGLTRAELLELPDPVQYEDGRTVQSFKDETNINRLLARAQRSGTLSHIEKFGGIYGEMADFDMLEAQLRLRRGQEAFDRLPSEVRREFNNSPAEFYQYVNDPANIGDLAKKLPALAKPGRQRVDVAGRTNPVAPEEPVAPPTPNTTPPDGG